MPLATGTIVDGKYTLERPFDAGNMGQLWLATQGGKREVAIKFVLPNKPDLHQRFEAEISASVRLQNDYTVRVYEWGTFEGAPYMVMERLIGQNLAELIRAKGPLPVTTAVDYLIQAACGVELAHQAGLVHRDLKPANLFLVKGGTIKLLDFGLAGASEAIRQAVTHAGSYMGTPNYSAPEQFLDAGAVDARADIWSLGAILYELLAGRLAFPDAYPAVIARVRNGEPEPLPSIRSDIPKAVLSSLSRCLMKEPDQRFASARQLALALSDFGLNASKTALDVLTEDPSLRPASNAPAAVAGGTLRLSDARTTLDPTSLTDPPCTERRIASLDERDELLGPMLPVGSTLKEEAGGALERAREKWSMESGLEHLGLRRPAPWPRSRLLIASCTLLAIPLTGAVFIHYLPPAEQGQVARPPIATSAKSAPVATQPTAAPTTATTAEPTTATASPTEIASSTPPKPRPKLPKLVAKGPTPDATVVAPDQLAAEGPPLLPAVVQPTAAELSVRCLEACTSQFPVKNCASTPDAGSAACKAFARSAQVNLTNCQSRCPAGNQ